MPKPLLHDIESTLARLWLDQSDGGDWAKNSAELQSDLSLGAQIDWAGVKLYASLLSYGQQQLMDSIYLYCAAILKKEWAPTVREYFKCYPTRHYNLNQSANRFVDYLKGAGSRHVDRYPFIVELADYEWIEMELLELDVEASQESNVQANLLLDKPELFSLYAPVLNPALVLRRFSFPISKIVERLAAKKIVRSKQPQSVSHMAIYRHPETYQCKFLDLSALAFDIIDASFQGTASYAELIRFAAAKSPGVNVQQTVLEILELIDQLAELQVFIGSKSHGLPLPGKSSLKI